MNTQKYWIVHNSTHGHPSKMHQSLAAAELEAHRLAGKQTGQIFFVLETVCCYGIPQANPERMECSSRIEGCEPGSC